MKQLGFAWNLNPEAFHTFDFINPENTDTTAFGDQLEQFLHGPNFFGGFLKTDYGVNSIRGLLGNDELNAAIDSVLKLFGPVGGIIGSAK